MSTEETIERNKKARTPIRKSVTRSIKQIDVELGKDNPDSNAIEDSLVLLRSYEDELKNLDETIKMQTETKHLEAELESSMEYSDSILLCRSRANRYLGRMKGLTVINNNADTVPEAKVNTKLPRITLKKFAGDIYQFQEFWPQYRVAVHDNNTLHSIEKFNYLKSLLTDSAATAIAGIPLTAENYQIAVDILVERFGKKDVLVSAHTNRLLNLKPVGRSSDVRALRKLHDDIIVQVRSLESLDVPTESYGGLLLPILYNCIPSDIVLQFNREKIDGKGGSVKDLLAFLKREVEAREQLIRVATGFENKGSFDNRAYFEPKPSAPKYSNSVKNKLPSATTLNSVTENLCPFCNENHKPEDCSLNLSQRRDSLRKQARCFRCYKKFHRRSQCRVRVTCENCHSKGHQKPLCDKDPMAGNHFNSPPTKEQNEDGIVVTSLIPLPGPQKMGRDSCADGYIYFQTVRCEISEGNKVVPVRLLLDSGAQRTFVRKELSERVGLEVMGHESLKIHTFGNKNPTINSQNRVRIKLKDLNSDFSLSIEALETENICADVIRAPSSELRESVRKLGICLSDVPDSIDGKGEVIDILVGSDYYWSILTGNYERISPSLVLNETKFGWTLHGRFSNEFNSNSLASAMFVSIWDNEEDKISVQLERFWEIESLGIKDEPMGKTLSEKQALEQFEESVKFENNRYQVKLPMKFDKVDVPNNYEVAEKRFEGLVKRFRNNPTLYEEYRATIEEYKSLGIVEVVEPQEIDSCSGNLTFYLPHHPVIREDKQTTKLRIVFDASAHAPSKPSLNEVLIPGPNLNPDLFDLILQFRSNDIALVADVEKAFLQISLAESDRDATRFLWIDNLPPNLNSPINPIIMKVTRVLFGVCSSPFLLGAVIKHHVKQFEEEYPDTCSVINSSMYVDDLLSGASTIDEGLKLATESLDIFNQASMTLRKWQSNSPLLKETLRAQNFDVCSDASSTTTPFKILGLIWDTQRDVFRLDNRNLVEFVNCREKTKRTVLQAAGRIFDPIGFLSPFVIVIKMIFQSLWERGIDWDQKLPEDIEKRWDSWCAQLPHLSSIELPRYYFRELQSNCDEVDVEIHCFSDASERAYGAVIYMRVQKDGIVKTMFVTAKSRLAPIKRLTLPRLELMGALIGSRITSRVISVLKFRIKDIYLWSDSNIVIHWIKSSSSTWKPFVSNRVSDIQTLTNPKDWRHCPGRDNPADKLTRGSTLIELQNDKLWWFGPSWLIKDKKFWPNETSKVEDTLRQEEARQKPISLNLCSSHCSSNDTLIKLEDFSSLQKATRVIAWIKRFIYNIRNSSKRRDCISAEELREAEEFLIKRTQEKAYLEEIDTLRRKNQIKKSSKIYNLCPFLDEEGFLRIGSRLKQSDFSSDEINPILLPKKDRFTEMLTVREHERMLHGGVSITLTQIRRRFWIPQGRQLVRRIIGKCLICRKYSARPADQLTGQLPRDRITESPPFTIVGVDFAGPIFVRSEGAMTKSYVALFTCAVTRAIHLELVSNMSTKAFLFALRRFLARRGACKTIYSDNAKSFKAAEKELQEFVHIIKNQELQDFIASEGIMWKFIVERAPWWGGFYERLVKSVKEPLRKILGRAILSFEELTTILSEIEAVINFRPLTYVTSDFGEPEPLTPAHFINFGRQKFSYPQHFSELENKLSTRETLLRRKRFQTRLLRQLWTKWKELYVLNLNSAHISRTPVKHKNLEIGDVVLLDGNHKSKLLWDLGIITDVIRGRDNLIRACVVKTPKGHFRKPVQLLYPFEVHE